MGLGNGNSTTGDKGSNFNYELKSLQGLQQILNNTVSKTLTPGVLSITGTTGTTLSTYRSFTFVCVAGTVTIDGEVFPTGSYSFSNSNGTLNSISYDASTSTDCKIIFVA